MSAKSKVTCLLKKADELIGVIKHEYRFRSKQKNINIICRLRDWLGKIKVISVLANNIIVLRLITFYLTLAINILILVSFKYPRKYDPFTGTNFTNYIAGPVNESFKILFETKILSFFSASRNYITALGIIQIIISLFIVSYFLLKTAPLLIQKAWQGWVFLGFHFFFYF